jgi:transketolase C-terminal domain/subunit
MDMFALGNILHGGIVDLVSPGSNILLLAMGWMVDVAMSSVLLQSSAVSSKMIRMTTVEADVGGGSSSQWRG